MEEEDLYFIDDQKFINELTGLTRIYGIAISGLFYIVKLKENELDSYYESKGLNNYIWKS